jgi:hypothetical protein
MGFFKTVRDTPFARNDSQSFAPLCVWIAICCAVLGAS